MTRFLSAACALLFSMNLLADNALVIVPSTGLIFGPHKLCQDCFTSIEQGQRIAVYRYDNGFSQNERRQIKTTLQDRAGTLLVSQLKLDDQWINNDRQLLHRTDDGRIDSIEKAIWVNEDWMPTTQVTFEYDSEKRLVRQLSRQWLAELQEWQPVYRLDSQWDASQNVVDLHYNWRDADGDGLSEWVNESIDTYDYNASGEVILWQKNELLADDKWVTTLKTRFEYTEDQKLLSKVTQSRFWEEGALENFDRSTYIYNDSGQLISSRNYAWNGISWDTTTRTVTEYKADGSIFQTTMKVGDDRFVDNSTPMILMEPQS